jgi:Putative addiction module component
MTLPDTSSGVAWYELNHSAAERAAFAQILLASLDEDAEIEEAWALETERRITEIENGTTRAIPLADALA